MRASTAISSVEQPVNALVQHPLWQKLLDFPLDEDGPYPFTRRLAKENGWPYEYALEVCLEYKRFLFLLSTVSPNLQPAPDVEVVWNMHLIYSVSYFRRLCATVLGSR